MSNTNQIRPDRASHLEPLAELVARVDLAELVAETAGAGRQHGDTVTYSCPSPTHNDSTPSFVVRWHNGRQRYKCFGCTAGGDALDYVQWIHGLDRTEAIRWLRARVGGGQPLPGPRPTPSPSKRTTASPVTRTAPIPTGEKQLDEMGREILAHHARWRGWPVSVAEAHGLHTVVVNNAVRIRYPFHVPTASGPVWFGWQDRRLHTDTSRGPKWLAPSGSALPLWGVCSLQAPPLPAVVICEGPADGITATYALSEFAPGLAVVAVPGVQTWRPEWCAMFTGLHVVTALDPDAAGDELTHRIATDLDGVAASVSTASGDLLTTDVTDALRHHGPEYVAAAILEPLHLLKAIDL